MNTKTNPLAGYFRQPKHYISFPSGGRWYPPHALERTASGEFAVLPMTASDEITLKTPDALLSGQSTVDVIQSCVPAIKDAWFIPTIDLDLLLIAIRIASYGHEMEVNPPCPKCLAMNTYHADLRQALSASMNRQWKDVINVNGLDVHIKPLSYRQLNAKQMKTFEEQKLLEEIQRSELSDEEKIKKFNEGFKKITTLTVEIVLDSIEYIETPDGQKVGERDLIHDFLKNTSRDVFEAINELVKSNKNTFNLPPLRVVCDNETCKHEWEQALEFDVSNFFDRKS